MTKPDSRWWSIRRDRRRCVSVGDREGAVHSATGGVSSPVGWRKGVSAVAYASTGGDVSPLFPSLQSTGRGGVGHEA